MFYIINYPPPPVSQNRRKDDEMNKKILMYCYKGESWESSPLSDKAIVDIGRMTARMVAKVADVQQEFLGRTIHIKRVSE